MSIYAAFFLVCLGTVILVSVLVSCQHYLNLRRRARLWDRFVACMDNPASALVILTESERLRDEVTDKAIARGLRALQSNTLH